MGFIRKHWKGECPLAVSFWMVFVLPSLAYTYLEPVLQRPFTDRPLVYISVTVAFLIVSRLVVYPWQVVGLLRAADRHYTTHGRAIIRYGVQAAVVVSLALTVAHVLGSAQTLVLYKEKIEFEASRGQKLYSLETVNQGRLLNLRGPLDFGVVAAVEAFLNAHSGITGIVLDSEGGQIYEGRGLALMLDRRGLDTYTLEGCSSACSTAFIGGRRRYLGTNARLGFHQYRVDSGSVLQFYKFYDLSSEQKKDMDIFISKNLAPDFVDQVFQAPHDRMWFPDPQTLMDAGVIHGVVTEREVLGAAEN